MTCMAHRKPYVTLLMLTIQKAQSTVKNSETSYKKKLIMKLRVKRKRN